ncbi:TIGR02300 family protein [Chelativorans sp. YIM 93263]|uniref:TIGR02300 family protein n=1 Tax=Chelativorans sp. YIM 93263 TaxID=2906648 RepID=UPI002378BB18|nr:TIGR02300 family protein [Chelativorans sp. YIM 93263]
MAKPELGTKRICPETGRKFYDLNKDPIISPFTGRSYPRSYFEGGSEPVVEKEEEVVETEASSEEAPEVVSLEDADAETKGPEADVPDVDDEEVDIEDSDDTFLEEDEEDGDDVKTIIGVGDDDEES